MPSLTITVDGTTANRIAEMVQRKRRLIVPANVAEIKSFIIDFLRNEVLDSERAVAQQLVSVVDIEVT
jgi:hypothetical protein